MMVKKKVSLNDKLDQILKNQKKILDNEEKILGEEAKLEELELQELEKENKEIENEELTLAELKRLEKDFNKKLSSPITRITKRDFFKGFIGASFGILGHFAFSKAVDIAYNLSIFRATVLYIVAFLTIVVMLYYTGFRNVKKNVILSFMPKRALILYGVSILAILLINILFGKISNFFSFVEIYKLVGANIMLAVIGAGTADLIGGNAE